MRSLVKFKFFRNLITRLTFADERPKNHKEKFKKRKRNADYRVILRLIKEFSNCSSRQNFTKFIDSCTSFVRSHTIHDPF
jgi:hypothetical protein